MKKISVLLLTVVLILFPVVVFADDAQNASDQNASDQNASDQNASDQNAPDQNAPDLSAMNKNLPKLPNMPVPPALPKGMSVPPPIVGMTTKTVVATSDGGIVIVEGNRITKLNKNLEVTKSVELSDADNTGSDKNTK